MSCGKRSPSEGLAQLPLVFQGPEVAPVNIYILLDGCLTHDHVSESGLIVCIEKAQSERGRGTWSGVQVLTFSHCSL